MRIEVFIYESGPNDEKIEADIHKLKVPSPEYYPTANIIEESFRFMLGRYYKEEAGKKYSLIDFDGREISPNELAGRYFSSPESCFVKGYKKEDSSVNYVRKLKCQPCVEAAQLVEAGALFVSPFLN